MKSGDTVTITGTVVRVREDDLVVVEVPEGANKRHLLVHPDAVEVVGGKGKRKA